MILFSSCELFVLILDCKKPFRFLSCCFFKMKLFNNHLTTRWKMATLTQSKQDVKVNFRPMGDRILAKRLEEEAIQGGIILPDSAKKKQEKAVVVAVGSGKLDKNANPMPSPVMVGEVVIMDKYAGQEVTVEGEEFVVVRFDDIVAVIEE
jgi:chaperonin GroES